jgi:hypothetical protein
MDIESKVDMAMQQSYARTLADEASCWFVDGLSVHDVLDSLASTGLGLTVTDKETDEELILRLAGDLYDCGHEIDFSDLMTKKELKKIGREYVGEIADALRLTLSNTGYGFTEGVESLISPSAYIDQLLAEQRNN